MGAGTVPRAFRCKPNADSSTAARTTTTYYSFIIIISPLLVLFFLNILYFVTVCKQMYKFITKNRRKPILAFRLLNMTMRQKRIRKSVQHGDIKT